jgi:hypothetical protein
VFDWEGLCLTGRVCVSMEGLLFNWKGCAFS